MLLPRVQAFEFNDQPWVPQPVRDVIVEALTRTLDWGRMMPGLVVPLQHFLALSGATEVLDLGSGAAGPARLLARAITAQGGRPPRFVLTDLYPRVESWERARAAQPEALDFVREPVDATAIPEALSEGRARMLVNVLHHLPPELVRAVLADAVRGSRGIFIAEGFGRNPLQFANFMFAGVPALALTPLLSERQRLAKALWTYGTPALLPISLWDGLVSTLRVYEERELRPMAEALAPHWRWRWGTWRYPPMGTGTYFYGLPR